MAESKMKKGLGKGLSALLPAVEEVKEQPGEQIVQLSIKQLYANPNQPRKSFDKEKLEELAASLLEHGMVQPLIVVAKEEGRYMIVAGERRFRAAGIAGLEQIPCFIRDLSDTQIREIALIENIQRENLNALEEAESYRALQDEVGYTQEQLAARLGKSRPYVANTLRLLNLDTYCAELLRTEQLSAGHARALLAVEKEFDRRVLAGRVIREKLSVRETERLAKQINENKARSVRHKLKNPPTYAAIENQLRYKFGTKVALETREKGGKLVIDFYSEEDLTRLIDILLPDVQF